MVEDTGSPAAAAPTLRVTVAARPVRSFAVLAGSDRANTGVLLGFDGAPVGALFSAAQFQAFADQVVGRRLELMREELQGRAGPQTAAQSVQLTRDPASRRVWLMIDNGAARIGLPLEAAQLRELHRSLESLGFGRSH